MSDTVNALRSFVEYARKLKGDEKGQAQVFCERFFQAFGHPGIEASGAELESRQKRDKSTKFIDLLWKPRLLLEMKKRGEKLQQHYSQAFDYWLHSVPHRPKYVVLCNFDEFWVYDFDIQLDEPVDRLRIEELPERYDVFNFMFPVARPPRFGNNRVDVTKKAADCIAGAFNSLVYRKTDREQAQRFLLQCVVAMFAEDTMLLPKGLFTDLVNDCRDSNNNTFDLIGGLFRQMNDPKPATGGRYKDVRYFNGGVFSTVDPVELNFHEIGELLKACSENWSKIQPQIFGTLFQASMGKGERHAFGAHYTSEADIQKVVLPTIVRPWRDRIDAAKTSKDLLALLDSIRKFRILDPACGSGNFLYVAYRELVRLELRLMARIHNEFPGKAKSVGTHTLVSVKQFFGIEKNSFGAELAKVTLMLAKELAIDEARHWIEDTGELPFQIDEPLPLDNLDSNILCDDALFCDWPQADAIIGNPPFQSKNKAQKELGASYLNRVRSKYPYVPGRSDYCVYWFRKAHDHLPAGGRAGLVGTNTIRQNYSREGGLDHILANAGTITEAVSSQVWSGEAVVNVSIVNWIKGDWPGKKSLTEQMGDDGEKSPWKTCEIDRINASLSFGFDVTAAKRLVVNSKSRLCQQGQTHGHSGFLLTSIEAKKFIATDRSNRSALFPFCIGKDILDHYPPKPSRVVIDFDSRDIFDAGQHADLIDHIKSRGVFEKRKMAAAVEAKRNVAILEADPKAPVNRHHGNFLNRWWQLSYPRQELLGAISAISRYAVCVRVTKRPIFEFLCKSVRPNDALQVFPSPDDYTFGILQSATHWQWFITRCSTLKRDYRYTSDTVFDTFPWPQAATLKQIKAVADAAVELRALRRKAGRTYRMSLRDMYRTLELPGENPLKDAHDALDAAVRRAYGMASEDETLQYLLELNIELANKEKRGEAIVGPGLPPTVKDAAAFITTDCIGVEGWRD